MERESVFEESWCSGFDVQGSVLVPRVQWTHVQQRLQDSSQFRNAPMYDDLKIYIYIFALQVDLL